MEIIEQIEEKEDQLKLFKFMHELKEKYDEEEINKQINELKYSLYQNNKKIVKSI